MTKRKVRLDNIRIDGNTQFRDQINQEVVGVYKEAMRGGDIFPPIDVMFDGTDYWLYDGFHRYFAVHELGEKEIEVHYKPGTKRDAFIASLGVNDKHGLQRNNATKRKVVEAALADEELRELPNTHIAKLCKVSDTFVASIRNPEAKAKQKEKVKHHYEKKLLDKVANSDVSVGSTDSHGLDEPKPSLHDGNEPSAEELEANERAMQADIELLNVILEADDKLAVAHEELKKKNFLMAQMQVRIDSLMREKNEFIKECKKLQSQIDKLKKAK